MLAHFPQFINVLYLGDLRLCLLKTILYLNSKMSCVCTLVELQIDVGVNLSSDTLDSSVSRVTLRCGA